MEFICPSPVQACALRFTREDNCGRSLDPMTPNSRVCISAFASVTATPNVLAGLEIIQQNACSAVNVMWVTQPRVKYMDIQVVLNTVDLPTLSMVLGWDLWELPTDPGTFAGWIAANDLTRPNGDPLMLEVQSYNANGQECGSTGAIVRTIYGKTMNWVLGSPLAADLSTPFTVTLNGQAFASPNWVPSYPGPTFPSWDPPYPAAGGEPDGPPPPILPGAPVVADPFDLTFQEQMQAGGGWAQITEDDFFPELTECQFSGQLAS